MSETMSLLDEFFSKKIAGDLGISPEQVTVEFIHEMQKRMYRDRQFRLDENPSDFSLNPSVPFPTAAERKQWAQKCRNRSAVGGRRKFYNKV